MPLQMYGMTSCLVIELYIFSVDAILWAWQRPDFAHLQCQSPQSAKGYLYHVSKVSKYLNRRTNIYEEINSTHHPYHFDIYIYV